MTVEIAPAVIEKQKMLDFAHTYDNIPLHTDEEYANIIEHASNLIADYYADYEDALCADELADYNRDKKSLATEERERHGQC